MALPSSKYECYLAHLAIHCAYVETEPDTTMEAAIVVVHYGISVDRSRKTLRHVRTVARD